MEAHVPSYKENSRKRLARAITCHDRLPPLRGLGVDPDTLSVEDIDTDGVHSPELHMWIRDDDEQATSPGYALGLDLDDVVDLWSSLTAECAS